MVEKDSPKLTATERVGRGFDRMILPFAPTWAANRAIARTHYDLAAASYLAAKRTRIDRDWNPKTQTADAAIFSDWAIVTARCREAVQNNQFAKSMVLAYSRNVVGQGIMPIPNVRRDDGKLDEEINQKLEAIFDEFSKPKNCDTEARKSFFRMQAMTVENLLAAGEILTNKVSIRESPGLPRLKLQMIEPEQLDNTKEMHGQNEIRMGVEVNRMGRPIAYWFSQAAPGEVGRRGFTRLGNPKRIKAADVYHVFLPERVNQTRGISWLANSLPKLRDIDQLDMASMWAARLQACIGLLVTRNAGVDDKFSGLSRTGDTGAQSNAGNPLDSDGNEILNLSPGLIYRGRDGDDIRPFAPAGQAPTYKDFHKTQLRAASAAVGLGYEIVARDYSQGNFSSQRQALLEDRQSFRIVRRFLVDSYLQPFWEDFVAQCVMDGLVDIPGFFNEMPRFTKCEWVPPGWEWIDPLKEATAAEKAVKNRFTTRTRVMREQGIIFNDVMVQREIETETAAVHGVEFPEEVKPPEPAPPARRSVSEGGNGNGAGAHAGHVPVSRFGI